MLIVDNERKAKTNFERITQSPVTLAKFIARYGIRRQDVFGMERAEKSASWAVKSKLNTYPVWRNIESWLTEEYKT